QLHPRHHHPRRHAVALPAMADAQARNLARPVRSQRLRRLRALPELVPRGHRYHRGGRRTRGGRAMNMNILVAMEAHGTTDKTRLSREPQERPRKTRKARTNPFYVKNRSGHKRQSTAAESSGIFQTYSRPCFPWPLLGFAANDAVVRVLPWPERVW